MRFLLAAVVSFFLCVFSVFGEKPQASQANGTGEVVPVFKVGDGIGLPALLPTDFSPLLSSRCTKRISGKVVLAGIVDSKGIARNVTLLHPIGNDLDRLALVVAEADRFSPVSNGSGIVATAVAVEMKLEGCWAEIPGSKEKRFRLLLARPPQQIIKSDLEAPAEVIFSPEPEPNRSDAKAASPNRVGSHISAPIPINTPAAEYSSEGMKKKINGECLVTLTIDSHGLPRDIKIARSLEPSLDQNALEAVSRYRFKPALRNGKQPIPVLITIAVVFRLN